MPMKLSWPRMPPYALILKPKPTTKNVKEEMATTSVVFRRITLLNLILTEPVSFIMKPTYAKMHMAPTMTTQTVSRISASTSTRVLMTCAASSVYSGTVTAGPSSVGYLMFPILSLLTFYVSFRSLAKWLCVLPDICSYVD